MTTTGPLNHAIALVVLALLSAVAGWTMRGWLHPPVAVVRIEMHVLPGPVALPHQREETEL